MPAAETADTAPYKKPSSTPDVVALRDAAIRWAGFILVDGGWTVEPPPVRSDVATAPFLSRLVGQWRRRDADRPWWLP